VFVSSKVEHKKFSRFGSSNLQNFFFADSRAIVRLKRRSTKNRFSPRNL
jgi:hypothetical protein